MQKSYINSGIKKVGSFLSEGNIRFSVPLFQRGFSWEREQIEQMWEDINETISENRDEYFLGSIVLNQKSQNECEIIDGQQRLATLTIIFAVIRDAYNEMGDERHAEIQIEYIAKKERATRRIYGKLNLNKDDKDFFKKYVQDYGSINKGEGYKKETSLNNSNKLIFVAYRFFTDKIYEELSKLSSQKQKVDYLITLEESISNRFLVIATYVGDESDAYLIFETLNDRGLELSVTDLLKNYLFSKSGKDLKEVQKKWDEIVTILSNRNVNTFLRHFWISTRSMIREKNLYSVLKKDIKEHGDVLTFVSNLKSESEVYEALLNPERQYWKSTNIVKLLEELNLLNVKQCLPFLLSCRVKFNDSDFKKILELCINFTFRYSTICNFNPNALERLYSSISIKIRDGTLNTIPEITKEIKTLYPDNQTFNNAFVEKDIKEKKVARYILKRINDSLIEGGELVAADSDKVNLEHVLPQNPDAEWEKYLEKNKLDYKDLVNKIGNMTLLGSEYNRKAANKFFTKKKDEIYKKSKLPITKPLCSLNEWNDKTIRKRQKEFRDVALNIWKI